MDKEVDEEVEGARLDRLLGREAGFSGWRDWGGASGRLSWNMDEAGGLGGARLHDRRGAWGVRRAACESGQRGGEDG